MKLWLWAQIALRAASMSCLDRKPWARFQRNLGHFAQKYTRENAPALISEEIKYGVDSLQLPLDTDGCLLGAISVRFLALWYYLSAQDMAYQIQTPSTDLFLLFRAFHDVNWASMVEDDGYPWPIFSIVDSINVKAASADRTVKECNITTWNSKMWLALVSEGGTSAAFGQKPPLVHEALSAVANAENCSLGKLSAMLAVGEATRHTPAPFDRFGYRPVEVSNRRAILTYAQRTVDIQSLLQRWPIWRQLDRYSLADTILTDEPNAPPFYMKVFAHRQNSNGLVSNYIRAYKKAYCAADLQDAVESLVDNVRAPFRFVEAGPHLGDCLLWTASRVGCKRADIFGFDHELSVARMAQEAIELNGFDACVDMRVTALREHHTKDASRMSNRTARHIYTPIFDDAHGAGSSLDAELPFKKVHIMKLHTNGEEDAILRGARNLAQGPGVGIVILNTYFHDVARRAVFFLTSLQNVSYACKVGNQDVSVESLQQNVLFQSGSRQLICKRVDLMEWI